jgi:hypothetical protein
MTGRLRIEKGSLVLNLPKSGRLYEPGWIDFEVTDRTINRTLVSDFVGIKRFFIISYDRVYGDLFGNILDLYLDKEDVTFFEEQPNGTYKSYVCRISISETVRRELEVAEYGYTGFAFTLEEV